MIETKTINFKTLSPLYIKGKDLNYGQSYVRRDDDTVYLVDSQKLGQYLYESTNDATLLNAFIDAIENQVINKRVKDFNFAKFLSDNGIYEEKKNTVYEQTLIKQGVFKTLIKAPRSHDFICDGLGRPYIPGSAVKGMLRTAVMYHMAREYLMDRNNNYVKTTIQNFNKLMLEYEQSQQDRRRKINVNQFSLKLQQFLFQKEVTDLHPDLDFFRFVRVDDSSPVTRLDTHQVSLFNYSYFKEQENNQNDDSANENSGILTADQDYYYVLINNKKIDFVNNTYKKKYQQLSEHKNEIIRITQFAGDGKIKSFEFTGQHVEIPTESAVDETSRTFQLRKRYDDNGNPTNWQIKAFTGTFQNRIKLDNFGLNGFRKKGYKIPFNNINELMQIVSNFYTDLWNFEKVMLENCPENELDISLLQKFYQQQQTSLCRMGWGSGMMSLTIDLLLSEPDRDKIRTKLFKHERPDFPAPKTRRFIISDEQIVSPLGWIKWSN